MPTASEQPDLSEPRKNAVIIEDDQRIRHHVRTVLEEHGWRVFEADNWMHGAIAAGLRDPHLVILDLGLPDRDGLTFIRDLRAWSQVPIIVVSARTNEATKIEALDAGANDYLTKPFEIDDLMARVARHLPPGAADLDELVFRFGTVEVNRALRTVTRAGQPVHLTPIEFRLLDYLIANGGQVVTYDQLLREVWGSARAEDSHYPRVLMSRLRQKLEDDPAQPKHLLSETAVGYRLVP